MHINYIGLGKMGRNMVERMLEKGHTVVAYDPNEEARMHAEKTGAETFTSIQALVSNTTSPRTVWLMVPHQAVEGVFEELLPLLSEGDTVIEGGNSPFKETIRRSKECAKRKIHLLDAGVSGGPSGARDGACIMVGGEQSAYEAHESLFKDLAVEKGYAYVGESGAGHFVKMIHNGIEYGMMQALAEGFDVMRTSSFDLSLTDIACLYNHGSVIESRLVGWLQKGYETFGEDLAGITGSASASGEGAWTVETAQELGVQVSVIEDSLRAREFSQKNPSYQGQVISVMRNQFGGHDASTD